MIGQAIILSAGRGSRMDEATRDSPKCLYPLMDRPLLSWQMDALKTAGISRVDAIGGYRAEVLAKHVSVGWINQRWAETNMVQTLCAAAEVLAREPAIVAYADIVYHPDHIRSLAKAEGDIVITYDLLWLELWKLRFDDPLSDAETFRQRDGRLIEIGGRSGRLDTIEGQYMGLLKFTPKGWESVSGLLKTMAAAQQDRLDMTGMLRRLLESGTEVRVVGVQGAWVEVDSLEDARRYTERLHSGLRWSHDWRWEI